MPGCQDVWVSASITTICLFLLVELWDLTFVGVLFLWVLFLFVFVVIVCGWVFFSHLKLILQNILE